MAENSHFVKLLTEKYEKQFKEGLSSLPAENKKDLEEIYKERWDHIKELFDRKEIYASPAAQDYLDAIVDQIVTSNPLLRQQNFKCFFSRSGVPNASYIGEGIIVFNIGLFKRLANESQVAFILCHELSHFYLQHSEKSMLRYVSALNSKEMQRQLQKLKNTTYGKRQQAEDLLKTITFDLRRHGRDHESEADSMAVEFMRNTRYDVSEALTALSLLDSIDRDTINVGSCLQKIFDAKDYPFRQKWLAKEEGLLGGHANLKDDEPLTDSLKTHPDCQLRVRILEPLVRRYHNATALKYIVDSVKLNLLRDVFSYEVIEFAYASGKYTRSLYYLVELLQDKPKDPYLVTGVGKIFNGFYSAQKLHQLGKFIDLPSPLYPSGYNLLLQFVQNLYLEDFSSISYHFLAPYHPELDYYTPFSTAYNTSKKIAEQ